MENSELLEVEVNGNNFQQEVLESSIPVLVDLWAPWCMPCRMISPIVEELGNDNQGKLKVCKLNTDENQNIQLAMASRGYLPYYFLKMAKRSIVS